VTLTFATAGDVLLREVLERPADDSPRLILADWLDEHGDEARAEFIRLQVEWARRFRCDCCLPACAECRASQPLRYRASDILDVWAKHWLPPPFAGLVFGFGKCGEVLFPRVKAETGWVSAVFRRGFVAEARLPCADFLAHAAALFGSQPVTRVELSDRAARESGPGAGPQYYFCRVPPYCGAAGHDLPAALWDRLSGGSSYGGQMIYRARGQAEEVLSAACVRLGRDAVGLPPLEG
jgi:uncharacterized protein (TIGR02996 family)